MAEAGSTSASLGFLAVTSLQPPGVELKDGFSAVKL